MEEMSNAFFSSSKTDHNSFSCNVCIMIISSKGGNTANMLKYLYAKHGLKFQECHVLDSLCMSTTAFQSFAQCSSSGKIKLLK